MIVFGLVAVPVELLPASRQRRVALRMLAPNGAPLVRRYWCSKHKRFLNASDIVRGYPIDDRYVVLSDEELMALAPEKTREIDLQRFVPEESIDPILFENAYFLVPSGDSNKAYRLLAETMESTGQAGIGTFVLRGKEHLAAIFAERGLMRIETLRFAGEIRSPGDVGLEPVQKPAEERVHAISHAIAALAAGSVAPEEIEDRHSARVRSLAKKKLKHGEDVIELPEEVRRELDLDEGGGPTLVDLMRALKQGTGARLRRRSHRSRRPGRPTPRASAARGTGRAKGARNGRGRPAPRVA